MVLFLKKVMKLMFVNYFINDYNGLYQDIKKFYDSYVSEYQGKTPHSMHIGEIIAHYYDEDK